MWWRFHSWLSGGLAPVTCLPPPGSRLWFSHIIYSAFLWAPGHRVTLFYCLSLWCDYFPTRLWAFEGTGHPAQSLDPQCPGPGTEQTLSGCLWIWMRLKCQPTFLPSRPDIFKEEGLGPGLAAGGFGSNLWTICAVLWILSGSQPKFQGSWEPKREGGRLAGWGKPGWGGGQRRKTILTQ